MQENQELIRKACRREFNRTHVEDITKVICYNSFHAQKDQKLKRKEKFEEWKKTKAKKRIHTHMHKGCTNKCSCSVMNRPFSFLKIGWMDSYLLSLSFLNVINVLFTVVFNYTQHPHTFCTSIIIINLNLSPLVLYLHFCSLLLQ
jgi:hypothetical protein